MKIAIIGSGIIGTLSAYYLSKAGHEVSVFEKENDVAQLASNANGAQLSYSYTEPMGAPSLLHDIPSIFLGKSAGIKLDKPFDPALWSWGIKLLLNSTYSKYKYNKKTMLSLSLESRDLMLEFIDNHDFSFEYKKNGKIFLFDEQKVFDKFSKSAEELLKKGVVQTPITPEECFNIEPAIKHRQGVLVGGILSPDDAMGDSYLFCKAIQNYLIEEYNTSFHFGANIDSAITEENQIHHLKTNNMEIKADAYLCCGGSLAPNLLKTLKIPAPIYPIKGYSIRIKNSDNCNLKHNVTDYSRKLVLTPLESHLRISGLMRFAGNDDTIRQEDIEYMSLKAKEIIPDLDLSDIEVFTGLRPYTPTSNPIIGGTRYNNMFVNIGHGMLGWTLSHGSCKRVADIISESSVA